MRKENMKAKKKTSSHSILQFKYDYIKGNDAAPALLAGLQ
jgi:hypothetical protein